VAVLVVAAVFVDLRYGLGDASIGVDTSSGGGGGDPRQLQAYPDDPLIEQGSDAAHPYRKATNKYWIFVHIIGIGYMLLGLNTVCDAYFTGALEFMVDKWHIKADVAGATFMAAGGSAPELFTSLIGAVITVNDVGFGTIVGSAVFNVLFVIGVCGYAADEPIALSWWPLFRDCSYYIFGLSLLAVCAKTNGNVELWEAILLFSAYLMYCFLMYHSEALEGLVSACFGIKSSKTSQVSPAELEAQNESAALKDEQQDPLRDGAKGAGAVPGPPATIPGETAAAPIIACAQASPPLPAEEPPETKVEIPEDNKQTAEAVGRDGEASGDGEVAVNGENGEAEGEEGEKEEEEEDPIEELVTKPEGLANQIQWYFSLPIYVPLYFLIPKPSGRCFVCTFFVSLLWIAGFSFLLVWWVEILGAILYIPTIVMGLTLLAAGTSIPDLVSSVAVARMGEGDMAVSSSIGSNIFDILFGLPIPWIIKIAVVEGAARDNPGFKVTILSPYIAVYVIILLFMVMCVILSIHLLGWVLNKQLGMVMALLYAIFLIVALSVEALQPEFLRF
jgi:sodium/potassium/calcium exchanger 2